MFPSARRDPEELEEVEELEEPEEREKPKDPEEPESMQMTGENIVVYNLNDDKSDCCVPLLIDIEEQSSASDSHGERSPIELFVDVGEKVEIILGKIQVDIICAHTCKRQRMETNTKMSFEGIDQKMKHEDAVAKLNEEFAQSFTNLFEQWNSGFQNFREKYVNLMNDFQQEEKTFRQEEKTFQQCSLTQNKRLGTIKQVMEQFIKNLEEVEKNNNCLLMHIQNELKEEMNKLQRKIMEESQL